MGDVGKWFLAGSRRGAERKEDAETQGGTYGPPLPVISGLTRDLASFATRLVKHKSQAPDQVRSDVWGFWGFSKLSP